MSERGSEKGRGAEATGGEGKGQEECRGKKRCMEGGTYKLTYERTDGPTDRRTDGQTDGETDGGPPGRTDACTDRQRRRVVE